MQSQSYLEGSAELTPHLEQDLLRDSALEGQGRHAYLAVGSGSDAIKRTPQIPLAEWPLLPLPGISPSEWLVMVYQGKLVLLKRATAHPGVGSGSGNHSKSIHPSPKKSQSKNWWQVSAVEQPNLAELVGGLVEIKPRPVYVPSLTLPLLRDVPAPTVATNAVAIPAPTEVGLSPGHDDRASKLPAQIVLELKGVAQTTPFLCERLWPLLAPVGLHIHLLSPNDKTDAAYLAEIGESSQNALLGDQWLLAKGLRLLTTVEAFLYEKLNLAESLNAQVEYLLSLSQSDFQLYRAARAGRDVALSGLISPVAARGSDTQQATTGMVKFADQTSHRYWLHRLTDCIPRWEHTALRLRRNAALNNYC
jgi:hypothetical protein